MLVCLKCVTLMSLFWIKLYTKGYTNKIILRTILHTNRTYSNKKIHIALTNANAKMHNKEKKAFTTTNEIQISKKYQQRNKMHPFKYWGASKHKILSILFYLFTFGIFIHKNVLIFLFV